MEFSNPIWRRSERLDPDAPEKPARISSEGMVNGQRIVGALARPVLAAIVLSSTQVTAEVLTESAKLLPGGGGADEQFGFSVTISGSRALIGAPEEDVSGAQSGAAYIFEFDGANWIEMAKLVPSDGAASERFGISVGLDGDRAVIGASEDNDSGTASGSAYVFDLADGIWTQSAKLTASDAEPFDLFGFAVSLDGDRIAVGSRFDDDNGFNSGSVYIYDRGPSSWIETQKFSPSDGANSGQFGFALSLSGSRVLVGAFGDSQNGGQSGAAYVFENQSGSWTQTAKLTSSDSAELHRFGYAVSLDGTRALIGAYLNVSAYVFDFDGASWQETAVFTEPGSPTGSQLGWSVDLFGNLALVGDPGREWGRLYSLVAGSWAEVATLEAAVPVAGDDFGYSVALESGRSLIGAPLDSANGAEAGAVYAFSINEPPAAQNDAVDTFEDIALSANVLVDNDNGIDSDPDGDPIEVQSPGTFTASGIGGTVTTQSNGNFTYIPPLNLSGVATFDYTIADPSGATSSATVTITVAPVNDQPTFSAIDPASVLEDAGPQSISNWAAFDPGAPNELQGVSAYTVSNVGVPGLFSSVPSVDGSGTLTFTPAADAFGTSTFDVTVQDDGGTANGGVDTSDPQTFTITIDPVNDTPSFANAGDVTEIEDGDYAEAWASAISAGPANEGGQTVSFMTTVTSNPGLFDVAPSVDPAGALTFTPLADTTGSASIEVVAMDDGGMANDGVPASDPATFTIDVIAAADLTIDKTSGSFFTPAGGDVSYTIVVSNPGPSDVTQATVVDDPPARLGNVSWTCVPSGSAACNPSGSVAINELVNLPEGASVTFTLDATLLDTLNDPITNTASVTTPVGVLELVPANNSDSDTDRVGLFADGMELIEP